MTAQWQVRAVGIICKLGPTQRIEGEQEMGFAGTLGLWVFEGCLFQ